VSKVVIRAGRPKKYTFWSFCGDAVLFCLTGGLWTFGIIIREWRYR
jgi:hypothetical protein